MKTLKTGLCLLLIFTVLGSNLVQAETQTQKISRLQAENKKLKADIQSDDKAFNRLDGLWRDYRDAHCGIDEHGKLSSLKCAEKLHKILAIFEEEPEGI